MARFRPVRSPSTRYASGFAVLTCLTTPEGELRECVVEMEHPHDRRFGKALLDAARRARARNAEVRNQPAPVRRVLFPIEFRMQ